MQVPLINAILNNVVLLVDAMKSRLNLSMLSHSRADLFEQFSP